jgi:hypothetical protein
MLKPKSAMQKYISFSNWFRISIRKSIITV